MMPHSKFLWIYYILEFVCGCFLIIYLWNNSVPQNSYKREYIACINNELKFEKMLSSGEILKADKHLSIGDTILIRTSTPPQNTYINMTYPYQFEVATVISKTPYNDPIVIVNGDRKLVPLHKCYVGNANLFDKDQEESP